MKEKTQQIHWFWLFFLFLSILGAIKCLIIGTDVDEQYAITMSYRMVCGDSMFLEMWEPHQTSGFLAAIFIKLFLSVTGNVNYLVIYLRMIGLAIQFIISIFLYCTMKRIFSQNVAFCMSFFFFNTISKNTPIPEFTNMLLWFSVLSFLCLIRFVADEKRSIWWLIFAGIFLSLSVLSYPTSILAVIPALAGIFLVSRQEKRLKNCAVYMGTCVCCGTVYLLYFLSHMSLNDFLYGLRQMSTDGSHSVNLLSRLTGYGQDIVKIAPHMLAAGGVTCIIWIFVKFVLKKKYSFLLCLLLGTCLEQVYVWVFKDSYIKFPCLFYFVLFIIGISRYRKRRGDGNSAGGSVYRAMFWFGSMVGVFLWVASLLISNTHMYDTVEYMMVGFIVSIGYMEHDYEDGRLWWKFAVLVLLGTILLRRGYYIYYTYGKDTIWVEKQKILQGPLQGVYGRWSEGVSYNTASEIMDEYVPYGCKILFVGTDVLLYLYGEHQVSNFSTICTPTFDERLYTYWERYPEKYPEYIVWDATMSSGLFAPDSTVEERLLSNCDLVAEEDNWRIYRCLNIQD